MGAPTAKCKERLISRLLFSMCILHTHVHVCMYIHAFFFRLSVIGLRYVTCFPVCCTASIYARSHFPYRLDYENHVLVPFQPRNRRYAMSNDSPTVTSLKVSLALPALDICALHSTSFNSIHFCLSFKQSILGYRIFLYLSFEVFFFRILVTFLVLCVCTHRLRSSNV